MSRLGHYRLVPADVQDVSETGKRHAEGQARGAPLGALPPYRGAVVIVSSGRPTEPNSSDPSRGGRFSGFSG